MAKMHYINKNKLGEKFVPKGIHSDNTDIVRLLKQDFLENNDKYKVVGFFRKSPGHYFLFLTIMDHIIEHKHIKFETILRAIPDKFGSRSKIFQIFKEAVEEEYLVKRKNFEDGREQIYYPSDFFVDQCNKWLNIFNCK